MPVTSTLRTTNRLKTAALCTLTVALTDPRRLARWMGEVEGELRLGGEFRARFFASGWEGTGRVEVCEPPRRLRLRTNQPDQPGEQTIEVTLSVDGNQTI